MDLRKAKPKTVTHESEFGPIKLQEPGAGSVFAWQRRMRDSKGDDPAQSAGLELVAMCVVGSDGKPYLTAEDVEALPISLANKLATICGKLCGLTDQKKTS